MRKRAVEVMRSVSARRVSARLDHCRDAHHAGTHSDAKIRRARDFPVPRSNLRRPAQSSSAVKMLGSF